MSSIDWDDLDENDFDTFIKKRPSYLPDRRIKRSLSQMRAESAEVAEYNGAGHKPKVRHDITTTFYQVAEENRAGTGFEPTIGSLSSSKNHISKHEREWIFNYLGAFYQDHLISDVLRRVKGGKEATVYCCRAESATGADLLAGKVYHERIFRSLKNDALYREGRSVLDEQGKALRGRREALAMQKKTRFGQDLRHITWLTSEFEVLRRLHQAGADVPRPYASNDNAILMEYIGGEEWPAPALIQVRLPGNEVQRIFDRLLENIELMLSNDLVHGDLSAHNILYWDGAATIIDFPQAVDPKVNPSAGWLLERDIKRVCQYFERYGVRSDPEEIARGLRAQYMIE